MTIKRKIECREVNVDRIAAALVDRLIRTEAHVETLQKRLNECFEVICEMQARIAADALYACGR